MLQRVRIRDEAYNRTETAFILILAKPACLTGEDAYDHVDGTLRVHVFSMNEVILRKLRANIGRTIRVTRNPFGEHTAHHHAPIVMNVLAVTRRK